MAANVTHRIYGIKSQPARLLIRQNKYILITIATHKKLISINAHPTERAPKKMKDQAKFKPNWTPNIDNGSFLLLWSVWLQISQADTPISR